VEKKPIRPVPGYLPGIDVVRALAALAVLACHAVQATTVWSPRWMASHSAAWATPIKIAMEQAGAWGVGIFFVLSGFCIHLPLARRMAMGAAPRIDARTYFARRFRRIYPPHLIALALSAGVAMALPLARFGVHPMISAPSLRQLAAHLFLVHTFLPDAIYSINHVLWTIAVEGHFYLLYPLLLCARRRVGIGTLCVLLLAFSMAIRMTGKAIGLDEVTKSLIEFSFLSRFWEWVLGCWLAERLTTRGIELIPRRWMLLGGLVATYAIALATQNLIPYTVRLALLPALFALAIVAAAGIGLRDHPPGWLVRMGKSSYSLYLVHPIALSVGVLAVRAVGATSTALELTVAVAFAVAATFVFFRAVEQRFLRSQDGRPAPIAPRMAVA
jgi:peptidoglycan/LPS O-acetylase OafA/YrhL